MSKTLKQMFDKSVPIELDKQRRLMLTTYAWKYLEEQYGSMAGALRGYAEMMAGVKSVTHVTNWLYALVQEDIRQSNKTCRPKDYETVTLEDMESTIELNRIQEYKAAIVETVLAYYPAPDPLNPTLAVSGGRGSGSLSGSSLPPNTAGATSGS